MRDYGFSRYHMIWSWIETFLIYIMSDRKRATPKPVNRPYLVFDPDALKALIHTSQGINWLHPDQVRHNHMEDEQMESDMVRIFYKTSPASIERLSKRLMSFGSAIALHEVNGVMYLEVVLHDDFLHLAAGTGCASECGMLSDKASGDYSPATCSGEHPTEV